MNTIFQLSCSHLIIGLLLASCSYQQVDVEVNNALPPVYPDYTWITIPYNIAPLNFLVKGDYQKTIVTLKGKSREIRIKSSGIIKIPMNAWKTLLAEQKGDSILISIRTKSKDKWTRHKAFAWYVSTNAIDPYLTYRLIEPGYEVWKELSINQRNIETFEEKIIVDNNLVNGGCINCHTYCNQDPTLSFFHVREKNGGTFINKDGKIRKINTKTDRTISSLIYGNWHPGSRYLAFSTNVIIPEFHSNSSQRLEVYDTKSDVVVVVIDHNEIITSHFLFSENSFETFPAFSADGKTLFFCATKAKSMPENYMKIKYSLCSIGFDEQSGSFGDKVDTLVSATSTGKTISQVKASPDGKYLLYTSFDYGNFPIWHKEADLHLYDLATGSIDTLPRVNSENSDTYHSWSSNSRWFVFASKRDNGMYGKPYIAFIDGKGKTGKPFVLPQENPEFYDYSLKSYNIPELSKGPVPFDAFDIKKAFIDTLHTETFSFTGIQ